MIGLVSAVPSRIVIFRALQLGDMLCTVPALRALRSAHPQAQITLIGLPWAEGFVTRFSHYLDDFISFPGWPGLPEQQPRLKDLPEFLRDVQNRAFDLAIQMQGSGLISNSLTAAFGASQTTGFTRPGAYGEHLASFFPYPHGKHEIHIFLQLMEHLGIPSAGEALEFPLSESERQIFAQWFQASGIGGDSDYAVLHPGARFIGRRLPPEKFARLGDALSDAGLKVVVTGAGSERELTQAVVNNMRAQAIDAGGQTDLGTLALLIKNARILISNDTGVSHIAAALETPSVILFTVSEPERWRPLNHSLHQIVLNALNVSVEEILQKVMACGVALTEEIDGYAKRSR